LTFVERRDGVYLILLNEIHAVAERTCRICVKIRLISL